MIERSLAGFAAAFEHARAHEPREASEIAGSARLRRQQNELSSRRVRSGADSHVVHAALQPGAGAPRPSRRASADPPTSSVHSRAERRGGRRCRRSPPEPAPPRQGERKVRHPTWVRTGREQLELDGRASGPWLDARMRRNTDRPGSNRAPPDDHLVTRPDCCRAIQEGQEHRPSKSALPTVRGRVVAAARIDGAAECAARVAPPDESSRAVHTAAGVLLRLAPDRRRRCPPGCPRSGRIGARVQADSPLESVPPQTIISVPVHTAHGRLGRRDVPARRGRRPPGIPWTGCSGLRIGIRRAGEPSPDDHLRAGPHG